MDNSSCLDKYHLYEAELYDTAIQVAATANRLVIYCGAGISQALTGVTWRDLVMELLDVLKPSLMPKVVTNGQFRELTQYVSRRDIHPRQSASLIDQFVTALAHFESSKDSAAILRDSLREVLYQRWIDGPTTPLIHAICELTISFVVHGKSVALLTTNYDTHLENRLRSSLALYQPHDSLEFETVPGKYKVRVHANTGESPLWSVEGGSGVIELVYLHGRIGKQSDQHLRQPDGSDIPNGQIVFSEFDYHQSQHYTLTTLDNLAGSADCTVIVGSSMDDPPLIRWIQTNHDQHGEPNDESGKVIVLQAIDEEPSSEPVLAEESRKNICGFKGERFHHIGVDYYLPFRCYRDIPDFFRDCLIWNSCKCNSVRTDLSQGHSQHTESDISLWSKEVSKKLNRDVLVNIHLNLKRQLPELQDVVNEAMGENFDFKYKIELWLRGIEPFSGDLTRLVKVADSAGLILDSTMRRTESYQHRFPSKSAALRSLQRGHPELVSLPGLGLDDSSSRWQAFYAIPLEIALDSVYHIRVRSQVPVGAMVLAFILNNDFDSKFDPKTPTHEYRVKFSDYIEHRSSEIRYRDSELRLRLAMNIIGSRLIKDLRSGKKRGHNNQ